MGSTPLVKLPGALQSIVILTIQTSFQRPTKPNRWLVPPFFFFWSSSIEQSKEMEGKNRNVIIIITKSPQQTYIPNNSPFVPFSSLLYFLLSFSPTVVCTVQLPFSFLKFPHIPSSYCLFLFNPTKNLDSSNQRNKKIKDNIFHI